MCLISCTSKKGVYNQKTIRKITANTTVNGRACSLATRSNTTIDHWATQWGSLWGGSYSGPSRWSGRRWRPITLIISLGKILNIYAPPRIQQKSCRAYKLLWKLKPNVSRFRGTAVVELWKKPTVQCYPNVHESSVWYSLHAWANCEMLWEQREVLKEWS